MAEPASVTTTLLAASAVAVSSAAGGLLPGLDTNALVGAISGGALFVTHASDLPLPRRLAYLLVSAGAGYEAAPEVLQHLPLHSTGVAAFLAGACVVTLAVQLLERLKDLDIAPFLKPGA